MVKTSDIKPQSDNKGIISRVKKVMKKIGNTIDDLGNPNKHIDNPDGLKYYEKDEYWEGRREAEKIGKENAEKTVDALDKYLERQRKKGKVD